MEIKNKLINLILLGFVFLAPLGFPLMILLDRILLDNAGLYNLVYLQTSTAFISFLIQMGARAGIRKEYLYGHYRVVNIIEIYIRKIWLFIFPLVSLIFLVFLNTSILPIFYVLNAIFTLLIGLKLVERKLQYAALFSIILFFLNLIASVIFIFYEYHYLDRPELIIELISLAIGLLFVYKYEICRYKRATKIFSSIVKKYLGLQVSSLLIVTITYVFSQLILLLSKSNAQILENYSDAVILTGVVYVFLSKVTLVYENNITVLNQQNNFMWGLNFFILMLASVASIIKSESPNYVGLFFMILLFQLGRFSLAQLSNLLDELWRKKLNQYLIALTLLHASFYMLFYLDFLKTKQIILCTACNLYFLSIYLIYKNGKKHKFYVYRKVVVNENN